MSDVDMNWLTLLADDVRALPAEDEECVPYTKYVYVLPGGAEVEDFMKHDLPNYNWRWFFSESERPEYKLAHYEDLKRDVVNYLSRFQNEPSAGNDVG